MNDRPRDGSAASRGSDATAPADAGDRAARAPAQDAAQATHAFGRRPVPLAPRSRFYTRLARSAAAFGVAVGGTLVLGMVGYRTIEHLSWLDAFHQAAMLLSGMGPVVDVKSTAGKIFDGCYALFCGVVLLASTAVLMAPLVHRVLHKFHLQDSVD